MLRQRKTKQDSILPLTYHNLQSTSTGGFSTTRGGGNPYRNGQDEPSSCARKILIITICISILLLFISWINPSERFIESDWWSETQSSYSSSSYSRDTYTEQRLQEERDTMERVREERRKTQIIKEMKRRDPIHRQKERDERQRRIMMKAQNEKKEKEKRKLEKRRPNDNLDVDFGNKNKKVKDRRPSDGKIETTDGANKLSSPKGSPPRNTTFKPTSSAIATEENSSATKSEMKIKPENESTEKNNTEENSGITSNVGNINENVIVCPDNKTQAMLNDNYCDCPDGSDEPNTSACSYILVQQSSFVCADGIHRVHSSRVNDGIQDCTDGSDEIQR